MPNFLREVFQEDCKTGKFCVPFSIINRVKAFVPISMKFKDNILPPFSDAWLIFQFLTSLNSHLEKIASKLYHIFGKTFELTYSWLYK